MIRRGRFALNLFSLAFAASLSGGVQAQASDPYIAKQLSSAVRGNLFMRLGYTNISVDNKSSDAYDVTGPVVTTQDLLNAAARGDALPDSDPLSPNNFQYAQGDGELYADYIGLFRTAVNKAGGALGTPQGIKAKVGDASTLTLSVGYWLTDEHTWVTEAYVLAAPMTVKAYGAGISARGQPNGLADKEILNTKMLPPLVTLGRYFGDRGNRLRPYLGIGATYAVFFDTRMTSAYDNYVGGRSSAKLKNAFGVGPFAGLKWQFSDDWHLSVAIGQIKIKTEATITTYNTMIKSGDRVLSDYITEVGNSIEIVERSGRAVDSQFTTKLMQLVAMDRGGKDLGTYVRKQDQTLTNTIFNISIGRSF